MQVDVQPTSPDEVKQAPVEPYVGPRSFRKDQREFFFGRDEEADELVSIITAHSAVLLYSQSGAGKTSLLNAKLIPRLEEVEHFNVLPTMRVQGQLPATFKVGKNSNIFVLNALMSCGNFDLAKAKKDITFYEFLQTCDQRTNEYGEVSPTVMVFDQFEELFTSYPGRWPDREDFFAQIGDAMEGNPKKGIPENPLLRVIFCMREDYIAELDPYLLHLPEKLRTRFRLEHLREKKALAAITKPLEKTNRSYAPGVAEQLVKNLLRIPSQSLTGTSTMGLYVEPVQLQVVCQSLWDALTPDETVITAKHLQKYGDVSEALSNFYEKLISNVSKETGVKEENLRRWFADTLITSEGTRAPVNRGKESTGGMPNAAVDKLEAMRLIKGEWKGTNVRWYELAHDRFIEPIRRSNEKWLSNQSRSEQIRLRLEAKASKWQPGDKLLDADELLEATRLVRANNAGSSLRALVDASRAGAQKQRIRFFKLIGVACGLAALIFLVMAIYAFQKRREAILAEGEAKSRLLARTASQILPSDPELSVLLAQEAVTQYADTREARDVIRTGLLSLSNADSSLRDNGAKLKSAEYSPDGKFILTRGEDGKVRLWDAASKNVVKELNEREGGNSATFSPDGRLIATAGLDGVVRIWDATTGASVRELHGHSGAVNRAVFNPTNSNYLATAGEDNTVRLWTVATGEQKILRGHSAGVKEIVFSPDGIHFASEAADEKAMIWSVDSDKGVVLTGLTGDKAALAFSDDGKLLATEGGPNTTSGVLLDSFPVTFWEVDTGKPKLSLMGHEGFITSVAFRPKHPTDDLIGTAIVTTSNDNTARLWTIEGHPTKELRHTQPVTSAVFSPDGNFVVTTSGDNTARVWASADGRLITTLRGHTQGVNSAAFSPDGRNIVTASEDQTARIWPFQWDGKEDRSTVEPWSFPAAVTSIDRSGENIVATTGDGKLWVDVQTAAQLSHLVSRSAKVASVKLGQDGKLIATTRGQVGLVYELEKLRAFLIEAQSALAYGSSPQTTVEPETIELQGHTADINSITFSSDGSLVVTASSDDTARVWSAKGGTSLGTLIGHTKSVNSAAFSPDGKFIVTASDDNTVRVWDAGNFALVKTLGQYSKPALSAEYSRDGNLIATATAEGAWLYDAKTGNLKKKLQGHTAQVNSVSFNPDSTLIVTASADNTVRVWNAQTGQSISTLLTHKAPVLSALFSADGKSVLTASEDYTVRIYPHEAFDPFAEISALIPKRVPRQLTQQERDNYLKEPEQ